MKPRNRKQAEIVERFTAKGLTNAETIPVEVWRWASEKLIKAGAMASGRKA